MMRPTQLFFLLLSILPIFTTAREWRRGDPCPETVKTIVPGYRYNPDGHDEATTFGTMVSVHAALSSCPNISAVDLRVTNIGCSEWPDRWNFPFKLEGGETYPTLKDLRLEGYSFDEKPFDEMSLKGVRRWLPWQERVLAWVHSGDAWRHLRHLRMDPVQRNKTNLDLWLDAMDWSQIESFGLLSGRAPMTIVPRLESMKKLELTTANDTMDLPFITGLNKNTLTHFTRTERPLPKLEAILAHHGSSLKHLVLHTEEYTSAP